MSPLLSALFTFASPCGNSQGRGLAVIQCKKWKVLPVSVPAFSSFECIVLMLPGPTPSIVVTLYRPLKHFSDFLNDFATFTHLSTLLTNIKLLGDFNIQMDNRNLPLTKDFSSCLDSFGFHQSIHFPTHKKEHDLVWFWSHPLQLFSQWSPHVRPFPPLFQHLTLPHRS